MILKKAIKEDLKGFIMLEKEFKQHNENLGVSRQYKEKTLRELKERDFKNDFNNRLKQKRNYFYFAKQGDEYAGYIYGSIKQLPSYLKIKNIGYLDAIIVAKKFRKKGVASILKKSFFKWLKQKKMPLCQINVASVNTFAIKAYKSWGFIEDEIRLYKKL